MLSAKRWMWNGFKRETLFIKLIQIQDIFFLAHKQYWVGKQDGEVASTPYKWDCQAFCTSYCDTFESIQYHL